MTLAHAEAERNTKTATEEIKPFCLIFFLNYTGKSKRRNLSLSSIDKAGFV